MKTKVYAIKETENIHDISNEDFIYEAEELGYAWSLLGFQNELNCEGQPSINFPKDMKNLYFRFIDINI